LIPIGLFTILGLSRTFGLVPYAIKVEKAKTSGSKPLATAETAQTNRKKDD
jgi:hypothetical protein